MKDEHYEHQFQRLQFIGSSAKFLLKPFNNQTNRGPMTIESREPHKPENRRKNKRKVVHYGAIATLPPFDHSTDATSVNVAICDLSYTGIRIEGEAMAVRALQPDVDFHEEHQAIDIRLRFDMPDEQGQNQAVIIKGRTIYSHPISSDRATIGLEFIDIEEGIHTFSTLLMKM